MPKVKLFYTIHNCGDGSASASFYEDAEAAQLACDIEEESGEAFTENDVNSAELEFDGNGRLLNPSETKEELRQYLAELRGEDAEENTAPARQSQQTATAPAGAVTEVKLFYTVRNCGDGSAAVSFHEDAEAAQIACDIEEESGEAFSENDVNSKNLKFDETGKLFNPSETKEELRKELAELRGEESDADAEDEPFPQQFQQAAMSLTRTTLSDRTVSKAILTTSQQPRL